MFKVSFLFIVLLGIGFCPYDPFLPQDSPMFLELDINMRTIAEQENVFEFLNPDTSISHEMRLLSNSDGLPQLYYSDIQTPVCIDELCKPVYIEMYWDLTGNYIGYGIHPEEKLSKYDHEEFDADDYRKLHRLLLDKHSVIGKRSLHSLYDASQERNDTITFQGVKLDGITGATKKEVKKSIISGALYSCYKLWYLANGDGAMKIKHLLPKIYSDQVQSYFLESSHEDYHLYALKAIEKKDIENYIESIIPIVVNGKPLLRSYILKKMPDTLYALPKVVKGIYGNFRHLDLNTKTMLIEHLDHAGSHAMELVSENLDVLSKNQVKQYLAFLHGIEGSPSEQLTENLNTYISKKSSPYDYLIKDYLQSLKKSE